MFGLNKLNKIGKINKTIISIAILFLSLVSSVDAYTVFGFTTDVDWIFIAYFVLFIVALMLGIAFMISKVFAIQQLEAWTKEEFTNLIISAAILVLFTGFIGIIENLSHSLANDILSSVAQNGQINYWSYKPNEGRWNLTTTSSPACPYPCHIYIARGFLGATYERYGQALRSVSKLYFVTQFYETQNFGTLFDFTPFNYKFQISFAWPSHADLRIYNSILSTVVGEYLKIITSLKMQEVALVYLTSLGGLFFIIGIVTRSVWFLRKFGGLLLATGIGLYTIFPMVYSLSWYTIDRTTVSFATPELPEMGANIGRTIAGIVGGGIDTDLSFLFTQYGPNGEIITVGLLDALGRAYLSNVVIPLLAIFTTIGFIRHFSPMIGGDVEIAGLTRII